MRLSEHAIGCSSGRPPRSRTFLNGEREPDIEEVSCFSRDEAQGCPGSYGKLLIVRVNLLPRQVCTPDLAELIFGQHFVEQSYLI